MLTVLTTTLVLLASRQVAALTMAVGLDDGFGEPLFAACFVFSVIVRARATSRPPMVHLFPALWQTNSRFPARNR